MRTILYASLAIAVFIIQLLGEPELLSGPEMVGDPLGTGKGSGNPFTPISIIGALVVFIYYWIKFSEWPGPGTPPAGFQYRSTRHSTTWIRYTCWGVTYSLFMVAAYFTIIVFPQVLVNLVQNFSAFGGGGDFEKLFNTFIENTTRGGNALSSSSINLTTNEMVPYAVIAATLLWAGAFSDFDLGFRRTIQQHALIPAEAQRLVDKLEQESETFSADIEVVEKILKERPETLIEDEDFHAITDTLTAKYARVEYVSYQVARKAMENTSSRVFSRYREELSIIEERLRELRTNLQDYRSDQIDYLKNLEEQDEKPVPWGKDERITDDMPLRNTIELMDKAEFSLGFVRSHFVQLGEKMASEVESIMRNLYQVTVCSALAIGKSPNQRQKFFTDLGFKIPEAMGLRLSRNTVVLVFVVLSGAIFAPSLVYYIATRILEVSPNSLVPGDVREVMRWTLHGCLMHSLAFSVGYLVQRSADQKRELLGKSPGRTRAQIADYVDCLIGGFALNIFLLAVIFLVDGRLGELKTSWAWALVPAVTAAFTGYFMHHAPGSAVQFWRRAIAQGFCTALATTLALLIIFDVEAFLAPSKDLIMFMVYAVSTTFVVGLALGIVFQKWVLARGLWGREERRASNRDQADISGEWSSGDSRITVHVRDVSDSGIALFEELTIPVGTPGALTLPNQDAKRVRVARHDKRAFTCLKFVREEVPELELISNHPGLAS